MNIFLFAKACFIVCILQQYIYIYHKLYVYIRSKWNAATMTLGCLTGRLEKSDLSEEALLHSTPLLSPATLEAYLVRAHASRRWFPNHDHFGTGTGAGYYGYKCHIDILWGNLVPATFTMSDGYLLNQLLRSQPTILKTFMMAAGSQMFMSSWLM